jgi:predicted flap endonuclease-1-like 5' DNA nuclease
MKLLQLGQLFALPLQSAIKAQNLALQETISFIEQFGLEGGLAKTFRFKTERMVEERTVDPKTGIPETKFSVQPFEVSIPLLAIVPPPSMQLQEMNVEFGVDVVEPKTEVIKSAMISSAVIGSSLASSLGRYTSLGQSNPTTMKVTMKIVRETPEGLARLGDVLTDLLSGKTPSAETPPYKIPPSVEKILGIGTETASILKAKGILTVKDFVSSTETREAIKEIAKTLGVSEKRVAEWREKSKLLIEEK